MFQQLLVNKHHRLRDSVPITIWPSGGLRLVTDKKKIIIIINPVQSKNRARPMAAWLIRSVWNGKAKAIEFDSVQLEIQVLNV